MKWPIERIVLVFLLGTMSIACGSSKDEIVPPSSSQLEPAEISSSTQGAQAASAVFQARDLVFTSTELFKNLGEFGLGVMASDPSLAGVDTDVPCADYGNYKYTGTYNNVTNTYDLTFTFSLCREDDFQYDGTYHLTGTPADINVSLGEASAEFRIFNFSNDYATLIANMEATSMAFSMSGSGTSTDASYIITSNGAITAFDYFLLGQYTMNFNKMIADYSLSTDASGNRTTSVTANGIFSETWTSTALLITFSNFRVDKVKLYDAVSLGFYAEDASINGAATFDYRPDAFSLEGILNVVTAVPIHYDYSAGHAVQGTIVINNDTTVQYNGGSDVDVTAAADAAVSYVKEYDLMKLGNFYALEQEIPPLIGKTGSALGSTMTISALSMGGNLNCYTDVHVNYYSSPNPAITDVLGWNIDWHSDVSCTSPSGIPFEEAIDVNGDNICDVGLDINGADQDITSGGVEHFTAATLPSGYYVLSINNYSCGLDTTNFASIVIGDYLFGTYGCTYTDSDGETGEIPGAWCRLADVRVNEGGTIDVLSPNLSFNPWH